MNYEEILFGLQPLLNADPISNLPLQDAYLQSYLTVLDQLAVALRAPTNRDIVGQTGLLSRLLVVLRGTLDNAFHKNDANTLPWFKLSSELTRCIANCIIDHDQNREIVSGSIDGDNQILDYYFSRILKLVDIKDSDEVLNELQMRSVVFVRNLCLNNEIYMKKCAVILKKSLLFYIHSSKNVFLYDIDTMVLASDLFNEFAVASHEGFTCIEIRKLVETIASVANTIENQNEIEADKPEEEMTEIEEIPNVEILMSLVMTLEAIINNSDKLDFGKDTILLSGIQMLLFQSLDSLSPKLFHNRLIVMRRLVSAIGHISANETNSNKNERGICIDIIKNSIFDYPIAAAFIVLSNSILSKSNSKELLKDLSLEEISNNFAKLKDPMQYQGLLDLLRKSINLEDAMFMSNELLNTLFSIISICHDQSKYYTALTGLLDGLIKKLLAVLPSSSIKQYLKNPANFKVIKLLTERGSLVSCLTLDKLLVSETFQPTEVIAPLLKSAFAFTDTSTSATTQDNAVSPEFLFQLTKTIGVYLNNCKTNNWTDNLAFESYANDLSKLLSSVLELQNNADMASKSVTNNTKFVAGIVITLLKGQDSLSQELQNLNNIAYQYFK